MSSSVRGGDQSAEGLQELCGFPCRCPWTWTFDPSDPGTLWGILRRSGEVVVAELRP